MKISCPYEESLKIQVLKKGEGTAQVVMPFRKELTNPVGFVHGGAIASLADTALAVAVSSLTGNPLFFTAKLEVKFRSPTRSLTLICDSKVESKKGDFLFGKATVREEGGKVVAEAQASFSAAERRQE